MRTRLRYLAVDPRGPQYLARRATELLALLTAVALVAGLLAYSPVVAFAHLTVALGGVL